MSDFYYLPLSAPLVNFVRKSLGRGWRIINQKNGMSRQMDALSSLGLLSRFVGMLTASRSFISSPRHEYSRRILCDIIGTDVEPGKIPASEMDTVARMVRDISGIAFEFLGRSCDVRNGLTAIILASTSPPSCPGYHPRMIPITLSFHFAISNLSPA